jgi:uncharacterized protein YlzI (FlbEa/FlbD family)
VLNSDLIKTAEASPDTMLTLINGEKLIVRERCAEVVERVLAYRARLLAAWPGACPPWRSAARCLDRQPRRCRPAQARIRGPPAATILNAATEQHLTHRARTSFRGAVHG